MKLLLKEAYDYGCIMAYPDKNAASKIFEFGKSIISEKILYVEEHSSDSYGREKDIHTTIKYGLVKSYTEEQIRKLLRQVTPFNIQLRGLSIFENDNFDVVKFDVDSSELQKLNEIFNKLPNHDEYPNYHPHITLAYVKKGSGKQFIKNNNKHAKIPIKTIVYSDRGNKLYINL